MKTVPEEMGSGHTRGKGMGLPGTSLRKGKERSRYLGRLVSLEARG